MMGGTIRNGGMRSEASGLEGDGSVPMMASGRDPDRDTGPVMRRQTGAFP